MIDSKSSRTCPPKQASIKSRMVGGGGIPHTPPVKSMNEEGFCTPGSLTNCPVLLSLHHMRIIKLGHAVSVQLSSEIKLEDEKGEG